MADDIIFAPLAGGEIAAGSDAATLAPRPKPMPIVPVPDDAPPCRWRHPKHGEPVALWAYHDAEGRLVGYAARVEYTEAGERKKNVLPVTYCRVDHDKGHYFAWRARGVPAPRPLYRLPKLLTFSESLVIVTEGEKKADCVPALFPGYLGTSPMHGAKSPHLSDWTPLAGRAVTIWPDHDKAGADFSSRVAELATAAGAASVAIVNVPEDWPAKWDLADPLPEGVNANTLADLLRSATPCALPVVEPESACVSFGNYRVAVHGKPDLIVLGGDLPATARALRDLFAAAGYLFDRDMPVKVVQPANGGPMLANRLTVNNVVVEAHHLCRPVKLGEKGEPIPITLPERVARMYLDMLGEWNLPPLAGISTAPLLGADGIVHNAVGYDPATGLWCCKAPLLHLPEGPRRENAAAALRLLREAFKTFPFADAMRRHDPALGVEVIDLAHPPGRDESAMLAALMTAICRASLWLAPGFLAIAPQVSGAGSGKGLLVRAICAIAFGIRPRAFTAGHDRQELDKRIVSELVEAAPSLFLDNVNGAVLRSDTLASVLTERPARVRLLGQTRMVALNSTAFIAVTGNGLRVSEDLARRFVLSELDARCEDPETRPFASGFLEEIERRRPELLAAAVTIWRYGRQNASQLKRGRPFGSFETWCEWVRDPLLTLGCRDPVERVERVKAQDPHRQLVAELFQAWDRHHGDSPVRAAELNEAVQRIADPQDRGRQYLVAYLGRLDGTRAAGFVLTRQEAVGTWGAATYSLRRTAPEADDGIGHRAHRDHGASQTARDAPMTPMPPMPEQAEAADARDEEAVWMG